MIKLLVVALLCSAPAWSMQAAGCLEEIIGLQGLRTVHRALPNNAQEFIRDTLMALETQGFGPGRPFGATAELERIAQQHPEDFLAAFPFYGAGAMGPLSKTFRIPYNVSISGLFLLYHNTQRPELRAYALTEIFSILQRTRAAHNVDPEVLSASTRKLVEELFPGVEWRAMPAESPGLLTPQSAQYLLELSPIYEKIFTHAARALLTIDKRLEQTPLTAVEAQWIKKVHSASRLYYEQGPEFLALPEVAELRNALMDFGNSLSRLLGDNTNRQNRIPLHLFRILQLAVDPRDSTGLQEILNFSPLLSELQQLFPPRPESYKKIYTDEVFAVEQMRRHDAWTTTDEWAAAIEYLARNCYGDAAATLLRAHYSFSMRQKLQTATYEQIVAHSRARLEHYQHSLFLPGTSLPPSAQEIDIFLEVTNVAMGEAFREYIFELAIDADVRRGASPVLVDAVRQAARELVAAP